MTHAPGARLLSHSGLCAGLLLVVCGLPGFASGQTATVRAATEANGNPGPAAQVAAQAEATSNTANSTPHPTSGQVAKPQGLRPTSSGIGSKPVWHELTAAQQEALAPLAPLWSTLSESRKRKWLALSANFRALSPEEKEKIHSRMTEWVTLSNQERIQARINYAQAAKLAPEERRAQWEAYQALSAEERHTLAKKSPKHLIGATTPVKPSATPSLLVSASPVGPLHGAIQILTGPHRVNMHTLLPEPETTTGKPVTTVNTAP